MSEPFPRRVLLTGDSVGGVWTFATALSADLIRRGIQVQLVTFGPSVSVAKRQTADSIGGLEWVHVPSKLEWMDEPWDDLAMAKLRLQSLAYRFRPDIVHLNTLSFGDADFGVPVIQTVHSCVCSWWSSVKQSPLPPKWARYREHVETSLRGATVLAAPSSAALADIERHHRVDTFGAVSIYNGIGHADFGRAKSEPLILSAGRLWDEGKNLIALSDVSDQLTWPVYLAGSRTSPAGAATSFEHCHLLGELGRTELLSWYARASIYVAPAKYEPFGLSTLEAALSGCALVLGDIPTLREIWGEAATFVPPDDRKGLLRAIEGLVANSSYRQSMSERALVRAAEFSRCRMTMRYLDVYHLALNRHEGSLACAS